MNAKEKIGKLFSELAHGDDFDKIEAAFELAKFGIWDGMDILLNALNHSDWERKAEAINYLGRIGVYKAIDRIGNICLTSKLDTLKNESIFALQSIGNPKGIPFLLEALKEEEPEIRSCTRVALHRVLGEEIFPILDPEDEEIMEESSKRRKIYLKNADVIKEWWDLKKYSFIPNKTYFFGSFGSPDIILEIIKKIDIDETEYFFSLLEDWTGKNFGIPSNESIRKWEAWIAKNRTKFIPGERYFYGYQVN